MLLGAHEGVAHDILVGGIGYVACLGVEVEVARLGVEPLVAVEVGRCRGIAVGQTEVADIAVAQVCLCEPFAPASANVEVAVPERVHVGMQLQGSLRLSRDKVDGRSQGVAAQEERAGRLADVYPAQHPSGKTVEVDSTVVGRRHRHTVDVDRHVGTADTAEYETGLAAPARLLDDESRHPVQGLGDALHVGRLDEVGADLVRLKVILMFKDRHLTQVEDLGGVGEWLGRQRHGRYGGS